MTHAADDTTFATRLDREIARSFRAYRRRLVWTTLTNLHRPRERYADFLRHMVRHAASVSEVIEAAACSLEGRPDAQAAFRHHGREERGHDRVAQADLKALGKSEEWFPTPAAVSLEAYTRELARERPLAILGFLVMAEGLASRFGGRTLRVLRRLGFSDRTTRFLRLHAEVDVAHFEELRTMCVQYANTPVEQESILEAVRVTCHALAHA